MQRAATGRASRASVAGMVGRYRRVLDRFLVAPLGKTAARAACAPLTALARRFESGPVRAAPAGSARTARAAIAGLVVVECGGGQVALGACAIDRSSGAADRYLALHKEAP